MKYYNWYNTVHDYRPSNADNECVVVDPSLNYQWSDADCNAQAYFICVRGTCMLCSHIVPYMHTNY